MPTVPVPSPVRVVNAAFYIQCHETAGKANQNRPGESTKIESSMSPKNDSTGIYSHEDKVCLWKERS